MDKGIVIVLVAAAIAIPAGVYAALPLFINTTIDEPAPVVAGEQMEDKDVSMADKGDAMMDELLSGSFVGVNDGIHNAQGAAKVISLEDGSSVLRLENFQSTNGPDLYVYLSTDKGASDYVELGKLKANIGNQNYEIPEGTDLSKYDTVLIWCKQFSVLFGSAELAA